ncbi:MAG: type II toxin-antitoxin system HipA family toxin [Rubrivivax sp.]|nr:MAG: type II toxin-antitoxin system HipA family toxin [Rubrivivax sp.]
MRRLNIFIGARLIGELLEGDDIWTLQYDSAWVDAPDGFALAPGLPRSKDPIVDGGTSRPVQWFFDNLLPEERLREAISKEADIRGEDAFGLLEYLGAESAGSLTLLPPDGPIPQPQALLPLSDAELSKRISNLPKETLTHQASKRMSLAGAQHKMLVSYVDGELYEPAGATASTHILKPSHPDPSTYPASVMNEYLTMLMAKEARLDVPAVHIHYVPEPVYIIERFDRKVVKRAVGDSGAPELDVARLHIIDACQLLNRSRLYKHSGAGMQALKEIIAATTSRIKTRVGIFRWLVFNILVANDDNHLKNLSFFVSKNGIQLAPHYDLIATGYFYTASVADEGATWPHVRMTIPLTGAKTFHDVNRDVVVNAGIELGLNARTAERIVTEMVDKSDALLELAERSMTQTHATMPEKARVNAGGESRFVRALRHIIIPTMKKKLNQKATSTASGGMAKHPARNKD